MEALEVPDHDGEARDHGDVFFGDPRGAIGELVSATTSLNPWQKLNRGEHTDWLLHILAPLAAGLVALPLLGGGPQPARWIDMTRSQLALGSAVALLVFLAMRPIRWSTYVGTRGVATSYRVLGLYRSRPRVFEFTSANESRLSYKRVYKRGWYTGTCFCCEWLDARGRRVFHISGAFTEVDQNLPEVIVPRMLRRDHPIYFAQAAAVAWRRFMPPRAP
jgi:hypothetical protein